ncbi:hypothetical protein HPB50_022963 [Hyalomma asiaticum]|uniref:Uncharacterized protein n=1 Tax=Hyalomma asiaticum TaxID=266040 RepID=A0ACB7SBC4_HYAAI|nr:hypothetical protein HPB50_022963 [Hyalomma asiaticum]
MRDRDDPEEEEEMDEEEEEDQVQAPRRSVLATSCNGVSFNSLTEKKTPVVAWTPGTERAARVSAAPVGGIEACRRGGLGKWHPGNRERERVIGDRRHVLHDREVLLAVGRRAFSRADGALGRWTEAAGWPSNAGDPKSARCATLV